MYFDDVGFYVPTHTLLLKTIKITVPKILKDNNAIVISALLYSKLLVIRGISYYEASLRSGKLLNILGISYIG